MKPEANSRRLFGITRSKGKMYEFGLPTASHIAVPEGSILDELFLLTISNLGDAAAAIIEQDDLEQQEDVSLEDLRFSASFFDAFLASSFSPSLNGEIALLASAAYYLASRPGSSLVLSERMGQSDGESPLESVVRWLLQAKWEQTPSSMPPPYGELLNSLVVSVSTHFREGASIQEALDTCRRLRAIAYRRGSPRDIFLTDIICAVTKRRMQSSAWTNLPAFSDIPPSRWSEVIARPSFPKELWPSQIMIGKAGLYSGSSGLIQMPTSAGKTKAVEIIIRSGFMSERTRLAVVIAPFRTLCHEISNSLRDAFRRDGTKVNELSDALQPDYIDQLEELFGTRLTGTRYILVLTPEKFLYLLRQTPTVMDGLGLVVYDEGHQFDTGSRGIIYELLLTEIKKLLPSSAQTILISAVIQNAQAIGTWLIGENVKIVSGKDLSPTARSIAFASWSERLGQLLFFETQPITTPDYFVPRIIEQQDLALLGAERKRRYFPERGNTVDVSLYLGLRLAEKGTVAIFCGRKDTAANFASRTVEIFSRGINLPRPADFSDADEIRRLTGLYMAHFGESADSTRAARLGVFSHHGNTPHGIRLSVEYAMQQGKIFLVACTSTLAQGVNLPIRYLVVSGVYQGSQRVKVRDFHNLMGRAGRAGKHTEGLIIFADPAIYDSRFAERWRMTSAMELLNPEATEPTTSSLLSILGPIEIPTGTSVAVRPQDLWRVLLQGREAWEPWAREMVSASHGTAFDIGHVLNELARRRQLMFAIESYLMANRGSETFVEYSARVVQLATETLAYNLGTNDEKLALVALFQTLAEHIETLQPAVERQMQYSKTILGIEAAQRIELWVSANKNLLLGLTSNDELLAALWPVLQEHSQDDFFTLVSPRPLPFEIANMWIRGEPY
jgi:POLQ-like helicase